MISLMAARLRLLEFREVSLLFIAGRVRTPSTGNLKLLMKGVTGT